MRNFLFLSLLFIPFISNAQTVVVNKTDTVVVQTYPKMVVIGDDEYHTVFISEEMLKQFEEMEAKKEDE